jgi:hypothetical protein
MWQKTCLKADSKKKSNLLPPGLKDWGLLRVDPERRFFTPSSKTGLGTVERVKFFPGPYFISGTRKSDKREQYYFLGRQYYMD